jgi:hypothetical protein
MKSLSWNAWALGGLLLLGVQVRAEPQLKVYGFLMPTLSLDSSGVESFSQPNASAYTAAGNPALRRGSADAQTSWEVAQSRVGMKWTQSEGVEALAEFDFIDFSKSAPTTSALPRVRRMLVQWAGTDGWKFQVGQDWDLVSPLAPFTYNLVGHYFQSGDIAFMRIQALALKTSGDFESGWAIGMPAQNALAAPSGVELGRWPTLAWRGTWKIAADSKVGLSTLVASIEPSPTDSFRIFGGVVTAFGEGSWGKTRWVSEAYFGQNTFNLGMMGLSMGDRNHPRVREAGAYVSWKHPITDETRFFGGIGAAWALNPDSVQPSYSRNGGTATLNSPSTGPGISRNLTLRVGMEHDLKPGLVVFGEGAFLSTTHRLLAQDSAVDPHRTAWIASIGVKFNF